ncbi:hypothetical protein MY8738_008869 [Beauveria namnaoensis]
MASQIFIKMSRVGSQLTAPGYVMASKVAASRNSSRATLEYISSTESGLPAGSPLSRLTARGVRYWGGGWPEPAVWYPQGHVPELLRDLGGSRRIPDVAHL